MALVVYNGTGINSSYNFLNINFDIVITKDKSKWTRSPIIETCNNNYVPNSSGNYTEANVQPGDNVGDIFKFMLRSSKSVNKDGDTSSTTVVDTTDINSPNFMGSHGMGWFPGYAIDVETGERLNIMFGEDSHFKDQNSQDMLWNPTADIATDLFWQSGGQKGELIQGGKHFIYVMGKNYVNQESSFAKRNTSYDYGEDIYNKYIVAENASTVSKRNKAISVVMRNAMWVSIPILNENIDQVTSSTDPYAFIQSDVKIRIRMANAYRKNRVSYSYKYDSLLNVYSSITNPTQQMDSVMKRSDELARNGNLPMYYFSTKGLGSTTGHTSTATSALENVNVVPNPYYAFNEYETSPIDHKIKFINLPNVCVIKIYNVGGTLVRTLNKDNNLTFMDWDLKNEYGISIAGGVYIIHIEAPGVGEKILKWFGSLRPIDLNNF